MSFGISNNSRTLLINEDTNATRSTLTCMEASFASSGCLFDVAGSPDHGTSCAGDTDVTFIARSAQPEVVEALEFGESSSGNGD